MDQSLFKIALPKWPLLVVLGKPVSIDQAEEIILRTDYYVTYPQSNDKKFDREYCKLINRPLNYENGHKVHPNGTKTHVIQSETDQKFLKKINSLDIYCLRNQRINSSYIGGRHGWCNFSGNIITSNYNIGKWPSVEGVYEEWEIIAKAFPFLDLTCQLVDREYDKDYEVKGYKVLIEYVVKEGKVKVQKPKGQLLFNDSLEDDCPERGILIRHGVHSPTISIKKVKELYKNVCGKVPNWAKLSKYPKWVQENLING